MDWIQTALHEYEQIASLCNAQSTLSNTVMSSSSASTYDIHNDNDDNLDPKKLSAQLQQQSLQEQLSNYYREIDAVRKTHSSLKKQLISIQENDKTCQDTNNIPNEQYRTSPKIEAFSNHIQLSERVIRTVMMQTSTECGILYANGLVRAVAAGDQHEINIVALAALRASVSQLKEKFKDE